MSLSVRKVLMIFVTVCCVCMVALGFTGAMSSIVGAMGWLTAGLFAATEIPFISLEQKVIAEAAAEIERIKEKNNE